MSTELDKFCNTELERLEKEREENSKFHRLEQGENKLKFKEEAPTVSEKFGKNVATFKIDVEGVEKLFDINTKNPIYRVVVKLLKEGKREITIIAAGKGGDTRWEVKE